MAYYQVEPWGLIVDDLRAGIVAATVANSQRAKNTPAFRPSQFMPQWEPVAPASDGGDDNCARTKRSYEAIRARRAAREAAGEE